MSMSGATRLPLKKGCSRVLQHYKLTPLQMGSCCHALSACIGLNCPDQSHQGPLFQTVPMGPGDPFKLKAELFVLARTMLECVPTSSHLLDGHWTHAVGSLSPALFLAP